MTDDPFAAADRLRGTIQTSTTVLLAAVAWILLQQAQWLLCAAVTVGAVALGLAAAHGRHTATQARQARADAERRYRYAHSPENARFVLDVCTCSISGQCPNCPPERLRGFW
ncbi:hypothetical protein ABT160_02560 [Streptomyces sp. NPDC001941]|uniref:hypothetical protein n=1 Tax=Streptomyces sp. NPDC001941 TaxID=3154659 RepID=UPI003327D0D4